MCVCVCVCVCVSDVRNLYFLRTNLRFVFLSLPDIGKTVPLMAWSTLVQSLVESYQRLKKWYLTLPCLLLILIRYGSRVKWSNPGKGVAPSPTLQCSSYQKGTCKLTGNCLILSLYGFFEVNHSNKNLLCLI